MPVLPDHLNHHIALSLAILLFLSFTLNGVADEPHYNPITKDYRPVYDFSYDVFKELPAFPMDFYAKKQLFAGQMITAEQLTPEYSLQPEILPGWDGWKNKIFGTNETTHWTGTYGVSIYPSRFDVFNIKINDTARVSALLSAALGVKIYQGLQLELRYDTTALLVRQLSPENTSILLKPTYPYFYKNWSQIIVFELKLLTTGNHTIAVYEKIPDASLDDYWRTLYQPLYTSGGSILGLTIPKMKIHVYGPVNDTAIVTETPVDKGIYSDGFPYLLGLLVVLIICGVIGGVYAIRKRQKKTKEKIKT